MSQAEPLFVPPAVESPTKFKRRLRNYMLDRSFQLRYTLVIVATSVVLTGGLGAMLYKQIRETSDVLQTYATVVPDLRDQLGGQDRVTLYVLVGFGLVLMVVLALFGIIFTHKVAGPLHKISGYLDDMRRGRLAPIGTLRQGDQLRGFYEHFREAHAELRERTRREAEAIAQAVSALEKLAPAPGGDGATEFTRRLDELRELARRKEASLT